MNEKIIIPKILCVLLDDSKNYIKWNSRKPFVDFEYNISYALFSDIGKKFGVKVIFAFYSDYCNGFVKKYWFFDKKWLKSKNKIKPILFYDKSPITKKGVLLKKKLSKQNVLFNSFELEMFCKDKYVQFKQFPDLFPKTFLVKNKKDIQLVLKKINSEKVIIKPRFGLGSEGIKIFSKKEKIPDISLAKDFVLQEFVDTSKGIPGTKINTTHDFRCIVINGSVAFSFVRMPKKGFIASIHRGAKVSYLNVPKNVFPIIKKVDSFVKKFGNRIYSIDMFFSNNKIFIIELNSKPGFGVGIEFGFPEKEKKFMEKIFKEIILKYEAFK